jgi:hypothetical protein
MREPMSCQGARRYRYGQKRWLCAVSDGARGVGYLCSVCRERERHGEPNGAAFLYEVERH